MKTVFLDFDGVLFDTEKEAYLLSRFAYSNISVFSEIEEDEYKLFYKNKYLVTNSWQYYYLMKSLDYDNIEDKFKQLISNRTEEDLDFDNKFQQCRKNLMQNHFEFWNNLDVPYPFFEEIKKIQNKINIVIVSTKNKEAIKENLLKYDFLISDDKIIGKEILKNYKSKGEFLREYMKRKNIGKAIFVDDSQTNLDSCKNIKNLKLCLADWGYNNPKYQGMSYNNVIKIIKEQV